MCGIVAIINKSSTGQAKSSDLIKACKIIDHRGPDDEGFLLWNRAEPKIFFGADTDASTRTYWKLQQLEPEMDFSVALGHRRLSIIDLSPTGYQPMLFDEAGLSIVFNGEIYNYLEIKAELETLGHHFKSKSDTEVILHAWYEWGTSCLDKFNGMFSFILLDYKNNQLFAVRDRFGVKPLYYYVTDECIFLASEIKQVRSYRYFKHEINEDQLLDYLATGAIDHTEKTFDKQIAHVPGGHYIQLNLADLNRPVVPKQWYKLHPQVWRGSEHEAIEQFRHLLTDSVKLRLRSDVTVGSCLSGGLDSSSIVCLAANLLNEQGDFAGQETVTACYDDLRYDEWRFAEEVIKQTKAHPHKVFPTFGELKDELEQFLWHQDEPTGSTSQFSQWAVFKKTSEINLKVMIDGQGADEQLAGYGGNDLSLYAGLLKRAKIKSLLNEAVSYKKEKGAWPVGFLLGALQVTMGKNLSGIFPPKLRINNTHEYDWLNIGKNGQELYPAGSLQENLLRQIYLQPLPSLLRYEDRNSMAWSVESRTPFMDYRLVEFTLGLPEDLVYYRGTRKRILRNAMKGIIPDKIENRKDKMGFVTPEEEWIRHKDTEWFKAGVNNTLDLFPHIFKKDQALQNLQQIIDGTKPFDFSIWRIVCLGKWYAGLN